MFRRKLIKLLSKLVFSVPVIPSILFSNLLERKYFVVDFAYEYSDQKVKASLKKIESNWHNSALAEKINSKFFITGQLHSITHIPDYKKDTWRFLFKDKGSYNLWYDVTLFSQVFLKDRIPKNIKFTESMKFLTYSGLV